MKRDRWRSIQQRAIFDFCKWDIRCEDQSVLCRFPLFLGAETAKRLNEMAEALTTEALAAEKEILEKPWVLSHPPDPSGADRVTLLLSCHLFHRMISTSQIMAPRGEGR